MNEPAGARPETVLIRCGRCAAVQESRPALRDHLVREHKVDRVKAIIESQTQTEEALSIIQPAPSPAPPKGLDMAKKKRAATTCGHCSKAGHNARGCPEKQKPSRRSGAAPLEILEA